MKFCSSHGVAQQVRADTACCAYDRTLSGSWRRRSLGFRCVRIPFPFPAFPLNSSSTPSPTGSSSSGCLSQLARRRRPSILARYPQTFGVVDTSEGRLWRLDSLRTHSCGLYADSLHWKSDNHSRRQMPPPTRKYGVVRAIARAHRPSRDVGRFPLTGFVCSPSSSWAHRTVAHAQLLRGTSPRSYM